MHCNMCEWYFRDIVLIENQMLCWLCLSKHVYAQIFKKGLNTSDCFELNCILIFKIKFYVQYKPDWVSFPSLKTYLFLQHDSTSTWSNSMEIYMEMNIISFWLWKANKLNESPHHHLSHLKQSTYLPKFNDDGK